MKDKDYQFPKKYPVGLTREKYKKELRASVKGRKNEALKITQIRVRCFVVSSKDLFDEKKNPDLDFSAEAVLKNKKIRKRRKRRIRRIRNVLS